jgi:hypothetical protein
MSNGAELSSSSLKLTIKKGSWKIVFDQVIRSANEGTSNFKKQTTKNLGHSSAYHNKYS